MSKYINMGLLSERALYVDSTNYQFYTSDIKGGKNSGTIFLFSPVASMMLSGIISRISLLIGAISDTQMRYLTLITCCAGAFILSKWGIKLLWSRGNFTRYYPTSYQLRTILENKKQKAIGQLVFLWLMSASVFILYLMYMTNGDIAPLLIATFSLTVVLFLILDNSPRKSLKLIHQLEKEYF